MRVNDWSIVLTCFVRVLGGLGKSCCVVKTTNVLKKHAGDGFILHRARALDNTG